MVAKLLMGIVVVAVNGGILERSVHPLHLTIGPGMIGLGQTMLNTVLGTDPVKQQFEGITISLTIGKLDAVIGQDGVDSVGHSGNEMTQEIDSDRPCCPLVQLRKGELGGAVDRDKQVQLAFFGAYLGYIDMKVADGVLLKTLLL